VGAGGGGGFVDGAEAPDPTACAGAAGSRFIAAGLAGQAARNTLERAFSPTAKVTHDRNVAVGRGGEELEESPRQRG
jgi:hypothetical protein